MNIINFNSLNELFKKVLELKEDWYYFLWEFLEENNIETDNLLVLLYKWTEEILLICKHSNQEALPPISNIYYWAYVFENEIYDFYGKTTDWKKNYITRLHNYPKDYFPKRKLWRPMINEKQEYLFTEIKSEWAVKVQVWPIHAGIISPGHFRFTCDGEDTLNLDIQLWWKHRWVENYFIKENDLNKLLQAVWEISWDSCIATTLAFVDIIEQSAQIKIDETTKINRVILLELERIYNHLWTIWAMLNDVWQWYLLNWFLEIREEFLNLNKELFWSRILKWVINFWKNNINLTKEKASLLIDTINKQSKRFENLIDISTNSTWIYDRFFTTWIVKEETAYDHSALWVSAKASWVKQDFRQFDKYYSNLETKIYLWKNWDVYDRFYVRYQEIRESINLIKKLVNFLEINWFKSWENNDIKIKLNDWYFIGRKEWHRWENLQLVHIENWKIRYYKFKDPSFINWNLLEYAVLNNIIADFPICNKSFDLSYSWFDL